MTPLVLLQIVVVVVGTAWCIALASTACFAGWYAHTHPIAGNDRVMLRLARLLRFLTFGLTEAPFPEPSGEDTGSEADKQPGTPAHVWRNTRSRWN